MSDRPFHPPVVLGACVVTLLCGTLMLIRGSYCTAGIIGGQALMFCCITYGTFVRNRRSHRE